MIDNEMESMVVVTGTHHLQNLVQVLMQYFVAEASRSFSFPFIYSPSVFLHSTLKKNRIIQKQIKKPNDVTGEIENYFSLSVEGFIFPDLFEEAWKYFSSNRGDLALTVGFDSRTTPFNAALTEISKKEDRNSELQPDCWTSAVVAGNCAIRKLSLSGSSVKVQRS